MSGVDLRVSLAEADVLEDGTVVVRPTDDDVRARLADFTRRAGELGAAKAAWTSAPGPPEVPVLVLELRNSASGEVLHLGLAAPAELWHTAPPGPITVALSFGDEVGDPDDGVLVEGLVVPTPALRP